MAGLANSSSVQIILDITVMGGKSTGKAMMRKKVLVLKCKGLGRAGITIVYVYFTGEGKRWDMKFF